jgi:hypothetical protein
MAQVNSGTVTTDGTAVIVGSGTDWLTSVQPLLGGSNAPSFSISALVGGDGAAYDVISVASDTSLTLSSAYAGANVSGKAYGITIDFTTNFGIPEVGVGDKNAPGIVTRALRKIDSVLGGSAPLTNVDIDGGTIDGTTIGGTTPAGATVTTLQAKDASGGVVSLYRDDVSVLAGNLIGEIDAISFDSSVEADCGGMSITAFNNHTLSDRSSELNFYTTPGGSATKTKVVKIDQTGNLIPAVTAAKNLGTATFEWNNIYLVNSPIVSSDERMKTFEEITDAERATAASLKSKIRKYKMNEAIEKKGADGARLHFGVSAQEVVSTFEDNGLDAYRYGLLCHDSWDERVITNADGDVEEVVQAGEKFSVRYDELLAFLMLAL